MNPQMMQMLSAMGMQPGMGPGGAGGAPNMGAAQMANPTLTRLMGQQGGGPAPMPGGGGPAPMPSPGGATPVPPSGPQSNPGMMPSPQPQTNPIAGMAGDSAKRAPEATGENPQRPAPQAALPHFPRNQFGAMLLPQGGQVGGSAQPPAPPNQAFNWNNLMSAFLQRQPQGNPMSNVMPQTSPLASPSM